MCYFSSTRCKDSTASHQFNSHIIIVGSFWAESTHLDNPTLTHRTQRWPFLSYKETWKSNCYTYVTSKPMPSRYLAAISVPRSCTALPNAPRSPAGFPPPGLGAGPLGDAVPAPAPCAKLAGLRPSGTAGQLWVYVIRQYTMQYGAILIGAHVC